MVQMAKRRRQCASYGLIKWAVRYGVLLMMYEGCDETLTYFNLLTLSCCVVLDVIVNRRTSEMRVG